MKILLLDNYDSFTWNLVHYLQNAGAEVTVLRNDDSAVLTSSVSEWDAVVLSPGPCTPADAGCLMPALEKWVGQIPVLGVCLGHQALGLHFGWRLERAAKPMHGKESWMQHSGTGLFYGLPNPMQIGRYHSLIVTPVENSPLKVTGTCDNEIMAFEHETFPVWGVQFHPESILTPQGQFLIQNWVNTLS
ncbi:MAG: aminodeoxychorismate/anthranilate synthase component II [Bacteroidetes bacterium]|nr:aminodeoxychorismate/anthranilate synthase component II [Bacteroidota bacterium]